MNKLILCLITISFWCVSHAYAEIKATITHKKELIEFNELKKTFHRSVSYKGFMNKEAIPVRIHYSEMEKIGKVNVWHENAKGRKKFIDQKDIADQKSYSFEFYTGMRDVSFMIPFLKTAGQRANFEYKYEIETSDMIYFSGFSFEQEYSYSIDTFTYTLKIPVHFVLHINSRDITLNSSMTLDSLIEPGNKTYTIKYISGGRSDDRDEKLFKSPYHKKSSPDFYVRAIVLPNNLKTPLQYFNDWYIQLANDSTSKNLFTQVADSLTIGITNQDSIACRIFNHVKKIVRYLDIENGIFAFKPRPVDYVLESKQGDCKDMSNALTAMLRYKGIEAYNAVSATSSHRFEMDFPALASANHLISVAKINGKWIFLDATEKNCQYPNPSRQIQGTKALLTEATKPMFLDVPVTEAAKNKTETNYFISMKPEGMVGTFETTYSGLSAVALQENVLNGSSQNSAKVLKLMYDERSKSTAFNPDKISSSPGKVVVSGSIKISSKSMDIIDGKKYVSVNVLPFPHHHDKKIDDRVEYNFYQTQNIIVNCIMEFSSPVRLVEEYNASYVRDGMHFNVRAFQEKTNEVNVRYEYLNEHPRISKPLNSSYNELNNVITQSLNHAIIIE